MTKILQKILFAIVTFLLGGVFGIIGGAIFTIAYGAAYPKDFNKLTRELRNGTNNKSCEVKEFQKSENKIQMGFH